MVCESYCSKYVFACWFVNLLDSALMFLRSELGLFVKYRAQASNLIPLCPDDVEIFCLQKLNEWHKEIEGCNLLFYSGNMRVWNEVQISLQPSLV